jgi:hypothetical protein
MKPPKRGGRPAIDPENPTVSITVRVPLKQYEILCRQATVARCSLPEHLRRLVTRRAYLDA